MAEVKVKVPVKNKVADTDGVSYVSSFMGERRFSAEDVLSKPSAFGAGEAEAAGALYGKEGTYTRNEIKAMIKQFLGSKADTAN